MLLLAHIVAQARFIIPPIYIGGGPETVHAAPYVALGLAALSFVWVSFCLIRGRAWGVAAVVTLALLSFSGFAYAVSWLISSAARATGFNAAHGLGVAVNAALLASLIIYYRIGWNNRTVIISEVSAK